MNPKEAKRRFAEGAVFVLLNVPEGTEFGIDLKSWNVGEKFRGLKMIPKGIHYIYYSAVSSYQETSLRSGFFYNFRPGEFIVKKWDAQMEEISSEEVSENEVVQLKENILAMDDFLGPYPYDIWERWKENTCYLHGMHLNLATSHCNKLSDDLIQKLSPARGRIYSATELELTPKTDVTEQPSTSTSDSKRFHYTEADLLKSMQPKEGTYLRLSQIPKKSYPEGSTPSEITRHCMDFSYVLEVLIAQHQREEDLLGEVQFCYIVFLVGYSFEAFEHWKQLINVFCSCVEAVEKRGDLFNKFLSLLGTQLLELPEDTFADILLEDNFLFSKLRDLFKSIILYETNRSLVQKVLYLKNKLTLKYGWDFQNLNEEDEDDAPVVVCM